MVFFSLEDGSASTLVLCDPAGSASCICPAVTFLLCPSPNPPVPLPLLRAQAVERLQALKLVSDEGVVHWCLTHPSLFSLTDSGFESRTVWEVLAAAVERVAERTEDERRDLRAAKEEVGRADLDITRAKAMLERGEAARAAHQDWVGQKLTKDYIR